MHPFDARCAAVALCLLLSACKAPESAPADVSLPPAPVVPTRGDRYSPRITAEDFAARLREISSDAFEGRRPGTPGERITTAWIRDQFERMGLKPANQGAWLQSVPVLETTLLDPGRVALTVATPAGPESFAFGTDMIVGSPDARTTVAIRDSELVFAGYGVAAPEARWDDYAGIDVNGKTMIVLPGDPGRGHHDGTSFKGRAPSYYGRWTYKYEEAARRGAAACLIVHDQAATGYPWQALVDSGSGTQHALPSSVDPAPRLAAAGWLSRQAAERLFARAGSDFAALRRSAGRRGFRAAPLGARLSLQFGNRIAHSRSDNVIGYLPGRTRPDEAIVYSAHWDHFGRDPNLHGDQIYNGAIDNGSGIAALLEIAEAFAHQQPPPGRSIVFLANTLEEAGLLGSQYYVAHPAFPLDKTVANINIDALPIIGPARDIAVLSRGTSQLDDIVEQAARAQGRSVSAGDAGESAFFRSDQLSFAKGGVPALYARSGLDLVDGGEAAGRKAWDDYLAHRYHRTGDDYDPTWDFRGVVEDIQALYAVGRKLANESTFPQWHPNADFRRPQTGGKRARAAIIPASATDGPGT